VAYLFINEKHARSTQLDAPEETVKRINPLAVSHPATWTIAVFFALSSATTVLAQEVSDRPTGAGAEQAEVTDTSDETPDEDGTKKKKKKKKTKFPVLPIPIFITEPAIGYGLGVAAGYFHPRGGNEDGTEEISPVITTGAPPGTTLDDESKPPPVITGIAAAYTDKDSWGAGSSPAGSAAAGSSGPRTACG
jgi:hypothetical protein